MITGGQIPEPPDPAAERAAQKERQRIEWRTLRLVKAGYDQEAAGLLAKESHVDLHRAEALLEKGCPVNTALLILL